MQEDPDQAEKEDDKASTGGISSLDFNLFSDFENNADALETTEPANEGTSTLDPQSVFAEMKRNLPESTKEKKDRRRCQITLLGNITRRRVGGTSPRP